jgi:hypothetical protein
VEIMHGPHRSLCIHGRHPVEHGEDRALLLNEVTGIILMIRRD